MLRAAFGRRTSHFSPLTASSVHQQHEGGARGGARGGAEPHSSPYWRRQGGNFRPTAGAGPQGQADSGARFQGTRDSHLRFYRGTTSNSELPWGLGGNGGGGVGVDGRGGEGRGGDTHLRFYNAEHLWGWVGGREGVGVGGGEVGGCREGRE